MDKVAVRRTIAMVASGYLKRWMDESVFDAVLSTPLGRRLKQINPASKRGFEASMYLLTAVIDKTMKENTVAQMALKQVAMDIGPELAVRILNETAEQDGFKVEDEDFIDVESIDGAPSWLSELNEQELAKLLEWLSTLLPERRLIMINKIRCFSHSIISKLLVLPGKQMTGFAEVCMVDQAVESATSAIAQSLDSGRDRMKAMRKWLRNKHNT